MLECFYSRVAATTYIWPVSKSCNWRRLHTDLIRDTIIEYASIQNHYIEWIQVRIRHINR